MPKPTAIERAIKYIKAHWREGKTLKEVAELYRVDAGNLERAFRKREGMTVKQFVDERRKAYVVSQLINKTVFGYELGAELGFANGRAFYRWVERAFEVAFAELRKRAKSDLRNKREQRKKLLKRKSDFTKLL
jgi:iron complex transport system substrate-binding protein